MTRSKDKVIERLSKLMPLTNPVTEESIAEMIKAAYEFKKYYKGKYTSNYNQKIMRRFYLYYARLYVDLVARDGNYSKSKRITFFNAFGKWANDVRKIFGKLKFEADFNDDDLYEMVYRMNDDTFPCEDCVNADSCDNWEAEFCCELCRWQYGDNTPC